MRLASILRWLLVCILVGGVAGVLIFKPGGDDQVSRLLAWIDGLGPLGLALFVLIYVAACLFFLPGSILTLAAGYQFGLLYGGLAVWIGSNLGAVAAFLSGRFLARDWIEGRVSANRKFQAIDRAVGQQGFKIVLLTRLSPVFPFSLLNYAYGLTRVSLRDYVLGSLVGMLPGTVMYVYFGTALQSLTDLFNDRPRSPAEYALGGVGLVATIIVTVLITRTAKRALAAAAPETTAA